MLLHLVVLIFTLGYLILAHTIHVAVHTIHIVVHTMQIIDFLGQIRFYFHWTNYEIGRFFFYIT